MSKHTGSIEDAMNSKMLSAPFKAYVARCVSKGRGVSVRVYKVMASHFSKTI